MNKKEKNEFSPQSRNIIWLAIGVAMILALFVGCMILLSHNGLVNVPWLSGLGREQGNISTTENVIPAINASSDTSNWFHTVNTKNLLKGISERDSYVRTFRIIHNSGTNRHDEYIRLVKSGNKWRAESNERLLISNGSKLYIRIGSEEGIFDLNPDSLFREVGIASTTELLNEQTKKYMQFSSDGKQLVITIDDEENSLKSEYLIMIENGLVVSEKTLLNDQLVRSVQTDSLDVFGVEALGDEIFTIPQIIGGENG